jgi:dGTPase
VRSGLITLAQLEDVPLFDDFRRETLAEHPHLQSATQGRRLLYETIRRMLSAQVYNVILATREALARHAPASADAARQMPPLLRFGEVMHGKSTVLKKFLLQNLYRHPQVMQMTNQARQVVADLFRTYLAAPHEMHAGFHARATAARCVADEHRAVARVIADYIAGMTDRFAAREHERLTGTKLLS